MSDSINRDFPKRPAEKPSRTGRHHVILRVSSLGVAGVLSALMITTVIPPIVADQSDRAVVNAPITLLTAPIDGEIESLSASAGRSVRAGESLARITNIRLDRGTLISIEQKIADAREKLEATREKKSSDREYIKSLDSEIVNQAEQFKGQLQSQIVELRARVAESDSLSGEKRALVERQSDMVTRNAASMDMLKPTREQYSATLHKADAERARLNQKSSQLAALEKGIYVGDDLVSIGNLVQKRRDIDLDAKRMEIEEKELSAVLPAQQLVVNAERKRLDALAGAEVQLPTDGKILSVAAAPGRHVNAGDTVASLVDCDKRFVVAIFSYRQGQSMKVGTHVRVDGASFGSGIVTAVLPKTSDKLDERFAVPFPQTERRELYAIISPGSGTNGMALPETAGLRDQSTPCSVGQWVTVTKENGMVPSMSVTWRRLETFMTSWGNATAGDASDNGERKAEAGFADLAAAHQSAARSARQLSGQTDGMGRDGVVSR
ncbi:MAG: HlyD family secretion protein [Bradyrhizobium sp.]